MQCAFWRASDWKTSWLQLELEQDETRSVSGVLIKNDHIIEIRVEHSMDAETWINMGYFAGPGMDEEYVISASYFEAPVV